MLKSSYRKIQYFLQNKAIVLCYHRTANTEVDPWQLAVSPKNFEEQLQVLKNYNVVTTGQLLKHLTNGTLKNKMVCITFDDGYVDNYEIAKPLLERYNCPSTFFIPVHFIGQQKLFWWDELQNIILGKHNLPQCLSMLISNNVLHFDLKDEAQFNEAHYKTNASWIWCEETKTKRAELYIEIWKRLRPLKYREISEIIENLRLWCLCNVTFDNNSYPMNLDQLKEIVAHPLIDVGIHTVTHPALAFHTRQDQLTEIKGCKQQLEELANRSITTIAYPYGIYNEDTINISKELGIESGFTTQGNVIRSKDNPLQLARFHIKDWDGEEFEKKLSIWIKGF